MQNNEIHILSNKSKHWSRCRIDLLWKHVMLIFSKKSLKILLQTENSSHLNLIYLHFHVQSAVCLKNVTLRNLPNLPLKKFNFTRWPLFRSAMWILSIFYKVLHNFLHISTYLLHFKIPTAKIVTDRRSKMKSIYEWSNIVRIRDALMKNLPFVLYLCLMFKLNTLHGIIFILWDQCSWI